MKRANKWNSAYRIAYRWLSGQSFGLPYLITLLIMFVILTLHLCLSSNRDNKYKFNEEFEEAIALKIKSHERKEAKSSQADEYKITPESQSPAYRSDSISELRDSRLVFGNVAENDKSFLFNSSENSIRDAKVFILLVENDTVMVSSQRDQIRSSISASSAKHDLYRNQKASIPSHIRLLMDILDAHRIEYNIDTTRTGLPTALVSDHQSNTHEKPLYSVMVIDDFINYTKLNRWMRDQLDRHCRVNRIGIISFLVPESLKTSISEDVPDPSVRRSGTIRKRQTGPYSLWSSSESSLANGKFPLTFKLMGDQRNECPLSPDDVTRSEQNQVPNDCLSNYQLNDKSPVLRLLKRRPDSVISRGPLGNAFEQSPWISMASNHVSYEPITWAEVGLDVIQAARKLNSTRLGNSTDADYVQDAVIDLSDDQVEDRNSSSSLRDSTPPEASKKSNQEHVQGSGGESPTLGDPAILAMYDRGQYDGIRRVIFGGISEHWLDRILILDSVEHLANGGILTPLTRYIQIDIDDIFVAETGTRLTVPDVESLVEFQSQMQHLIPNFRLNLGYSGKFFKRGNELEQSADELLVSQDYRDKFDWFCHTFSHSKAHLSNETHRIEQELQLNLKFAREHKLPIVGHPRQGESSSRIGRGRVSDERNEEDLDQLPATYAIAPHHSGVYPIHEQLFEAWRKVLNVQVTSTEEYPHLKPAHFRRGFVHNSIKVLPRQTCGLYTHTIRKVDYPGGWERQLDSIRGGELFQTVLHNPVNIYMSHQTNYANDRLAPETFLALVEFIQRETNLQLQWTPPLDLANHYFNMYPRELSSPTWTNPCNDKRHLAIWADWKRSTFCGREPKLLIVGPQKTGSTALATFLKIHPLLRSSVMSPTDFEEVQFFNNKHYSKGVDWYFSRFHQNKREPLTNETGIDILDEAVIYFDKSATYFDEPEAPYRASQLLPDAKIVILLADPADRAYSWYQHQRAHDDETANRFTFEQVIESSLEDQQRWPGLRALRNRCLQPGLYAQHLASWLLYFPARQLIIIDSQWFKLNPAAVLNKLQLLMRLPERIDFNQRLVLNHEKGFYCELNSETGSTKCLGSGKGRHYPRMSERAQKYLDRFFGNQKRQLASILTQIGQPLPIWLESRRPIG